MIADAEPLGETKGVAEPLCGLGNVCIRELRNETARWHRAVGAHRSNQHNENRTNWNAK